MPRIPRAWAASFHPQAVRRGSPMAYRPGWRATGMQPMRRVPIGAYSRKAAGVPLTGGQNQGLIPGTSVTGSFPAPPVFSTIAVLTFPRDGTYTITWTVALAGTVAAAEQNNFQLFLAGVTLIATSVNAAADGTYAQASVQVTTTAGTQLFLTNPLPGTAGSIYSGTVTAALHGASLTLTAGPQGLGTIWYPAQVTLSTTTGALDTSTALVYLGAQGIPITLVGTVFTGNGTVALAIPSMSPGQVLIVTWAGGHPGDTAAFNIVGSMDALTTG